MKNRFLAALFALVLATVSLSAQGTNRTTPSTATTASTSITSSTCPGTGCVALVVSGRASVAIQVTGTWAGTLTFEGLVDTATGTYAPLNMAPIDGSAAASSSTTSNGVYVGSVGGLASVRARMSVYTSGTAVLAIQSVEPGGGSGGGGGGSASDVTIHDPNTTSQKVAVNASGQLSITCANCSGSGASAVDGSTYTAGSTSGAPAMGFYHSTIDTVADGKTATLAMDPKRNLFTVIRDAADNARGVNVTSGNALTVDASATTQPVSIADNSLVTLGAKADAKSTATDTTSITLMSVLKEISFMEQTPATRAVTNAGTFLVQSAESGTWNITNVSGTVSLPTLASTSTKQSDGSQKTQIVDGSGNVIASTSNNLNVQCANCSGSGASAADEASMTEGTSTFAPAGGYYKTSLTALTNGQQGMVALTPSRSFHVSLYDASGGAIAPALDSSLTTIDTDLKANITLHAGTNVIGHVIADTGSTTAVTQATGSNLHAVLDANSGVDIGKLTANQSVNLAQLVGTATDVNSGNKSAGTLRVVLATDQPALTNALSVKPTDGTNALLVKACDSIEPTTVAISQTASTKLISQTSAKTNYICSVMLIGADAENVSIVEGTGSTCGTSTAAVVGGTTAANGLNMAANGGAVLPFQVKGTGTNLDLCLFQSGSGRVSGVLTYVQR